MKFFKKYVNGVLDLVGTSEDLPNNVVEISEEEYIEQLKIIEENVVHVFPEEGDDLEHV